MAAVGRLGTTHFTLDKHRAFILGHGEQVVVFPVLQCPCLTPERQFDPLCAVCHGVGRYYPPGSAYSTSMLLTRDQSERTVLEPGSWIPGTIQATLLPGIVLADRDKVRRLALKTTFTDEVLLRGDDETLRFSAGVEIHLVADRSTTYVPGADYTLTPPNTITWLAGGQSPAFMAQYSVRYAAHPDYLVSPDHPRERAEMGVQLSQVVLLHRLDMLSEEA
jgi:hypothetical protein